MRLSDAIRLGSMLKPQGFHEFYDESGGSCALGAAQDAIGTAALSPAYPFLLRQRCVCPKRWWILPCPQRASVFSIITHLNDTHRWTRERIADWVATIEPPDSSSEGDTQRTASATAADAVPVAVGDGGC